MAFMPLLLALFIVFSSWGLRIFRGQDILGRDTRLNPVKAEREPAFISGMGYRGYR
jgi:hypothetical protein